MEDLSQLAEIGIEIAHKATEVAEVLSQCETQLADLLRRIGDAPNDQPEGKQQLHDCTKEMLAQLGAACDAMGVTRLARKRAEAPQAPEPVKFRCALVVAMSKDERYTWACAYAVALATPDTSAEQAATIADRAIVELRETMAKRGA